MNKPILQRLTVETRYLVMIEPDDGRIRPFGPMFDMGHGGKEGRSFPEVSRGQGIIEVSQGCGFKSETEARAYLARVKLYIEDILALPPKKRAGSAKHWR